MAAPPPRRPSTGPKVWLQFSHDIGPHTFVVGKLLEQANTIKQIKIIRSDGEWQSEPTPVRRTARSP
jgi:hypothetical protein